MRKTAITRSVIRRAAMAAAVLFLLVIVVTASFVRRNKAYGNTYADKTCVSIRIEEGDTLWTIASSFYVPECGTLKEYIKEIKDTNGLKSDYIHAGNYLLIPCYKSAE